MKDEVLFCENQPLRRAWWIIALLVPLYAVAVWAIVETFLYKDFGLKDLAMIYSWFLILTFGLFFLLYFKQRTIITGEGIYVRFVPLDVKTRFFAWEDVEEAYIRNHNFNKRAVIAGVVPLSGLLWKEKFKRGDKVYEVSGKVGLQLVLKNGKKILIGTNKWVELEEVLKKIDESANR